MGYGSRLIDAAVGLHERRETLRRQRAVMCRRADSLNRSSVMQHRQFEREATVRKGTRDHVVSSSGHPARIWNGHRDGRSPGSRVKAFVRLPGIARSQ
jgi:hypothetical protein